GDPWWTPDAAGQAAIIFVQLPRSAVEDTSGGSLTGFVLDALHYIDERTTTRTADNEIRKLPVAINLSYGTFAGPHDGNSIIERAIDEFVERRTECAVVVAAGNAFDKNIHARLSIAAY